MKYQVLFSLKNNENVSKMPSAAVVIGALRVKVNRYHFNGNNFVNFVLPPFSTGAGQLLKAVFAPNRSKCFL